jgi:hypothetical protein
MKEEYVAVNTSNIDGENVAPCACSNCNTAHRKCDRKLPACGGCTRKKKTDTCTYEYIPAKRLKRQIEKQKNQPYPPPTNLPERNLRQESTEEIRKQQSSPFKIPTLSQLDMQIEQNTIESKFNTHNPILPPINISTLLFEQVNPAQNGIKQQQNKQVSTTSVLSPTNLPKRQTSIIVSPREPLNTTTTLEKYFENIYLNCPLTNYANAQALLTYRRKIITENDSSLLGSLITNRDDVALIFAMQAYYYRRFDVFNLSQKCFEIGRSIASLSFDTVLKSFSLASAFVYLGLVLYDEGELERASFYFSTVETFLRKNPTTIPDTPIDEALQTIQYRYLRCLNGVGSYFVNGETDIKSMLKCQIAIHFLSKQYLRLKAIWDRQGPQNEGDDIDEFIPCLDMIVNDIINGTDHFRLDPGMIDVLSKKIRHTFDAPSERGLETDIRTKRIGFLLLAQAAKIQCFSDHPEYKNLPEIGTAIRQIADLIVALSTTGIFNFCSYLVSQPIAIALSVHINCLSKATQPNERAKLVELIKLGSRALVVLSSRYNKTIMPKYEPLIREGEAAIKMYEERQQLVQLCTSLQSQTDHVRPAFSPLLPSASPDPSSLLVTLLDATPVRPVSGNTGEISNAEFETFLGEFLGEEEMPMTLPGTHTENNEFLFL